MTASICSVDGCDEFPLARGWCNRHYKRWRRYGNPEEVHMRPQGLAVAEAFRHHLPGDPPESGCWLWPAPAGKVATYLKAEGRAWVATRVSYELFVGPLTDDLELVQTCSTPGCVHPRHLSPQDRAGRVAHTVSRGRHAHGRLHGCAKLDEDKVRSARARHTAGQTITALAEELGVTYGTLWQAIHRQTWKHVV